jgi:hypothetical protein
MTTLAALVAQTPGATRGVAAQYTYNGGGWRFVLELADPSAGSSVQWYDITGLVNPKVWTGYDLTRGADVYLGPYRASIATLDLYADDDRIAPWNPDTSALFGTHVELGPGLMLRAGFIRVSGGVVVEWNPRFTNKVEFWGDASYSKGRVRQHRVIARDTLSSLVNVPLPATSEENWSDRMFHFLTDSGWPYGSAIYGAQFLPGAVPVLTLPDRPAVSSAVTELDNIVDPVGLVWYTNRLGQLVVRPRIDDTFHAAAFLAGATGDPYPGDVSPVSFTWWACEGDIPGESPSDDASYAIDTNSIESFGFDKDEQNVYNHVKISDPISPGFEDDDPVSIQRYDRKTFAASWLAANDTIAAQILATRANSVVMARPLHTTAQLEGFFPGPANLDFLGYVSIDHRNGDEGMSVTGNGWLRHYRETVRPLGCDIEWTMTYTVDIYDVSATASLLPVYNLHLVGITDWAAEFGWNDPVQTVTPTHTQYRLNDGLWLTTDYPGPVADAVLWSSLTADTRYIFRVRLVRIVDGVVVAFSPTRSITVRTDPAIDPIITAPGDGTITVTAPPMSSVCVLDVEIQVLTPPSTWTAVPGFTAILSPGEVYEPDTSSLDPDLTYRVWTLEFCSGIPDPGGPTITPVTLGCQDPDRLATAPYNDANLIAYFPQICGTGIEEAVSNEAVTPGPAYAGISFDAGGLPVMTSSAEGTIGYGIDPVGAVPDPDDDLTIACRVKLSAQPTTTRTLFNYGGLFITVSSSGAGYRVQGNCNEDGSGITTIFGSTVLSLGTVYDIALKHDMASESLYLRINGQDEASALTTVGGRFNFGLYEIGAAASSWITDCAVWDKVLDDADLPGWYNPLLLSGWWGLGFHAQTTYNKTLVGAGVVKLAGANGYDGGGGGALVVTKSLGDYVVSIGEAPQGTPNYIAYYTETWGFGGWGGESGIYGDGQIPSIRHGGGRTELRTGSSRTTAVLIAPGGGTTTGAAGGFPDGTPATSTGGGFSGFTGTGATASAPGVKGAGYRSYNEGGNGDNTVDGSGLGCGGRGGNGNVDFGSGGAGGGGGAGKHGGGGGAGGNGSFVGGQGGGGGSGDTSGAATVIGTYSGVSKGMGLAAMQAEVEYSTTAVNFIAANSPRTYIPGEEAVNGNCIVVADLVSGKAFWDREAATIFDGVAATPLQRFQGYSINARGAMHVSRNGVHSQADFQCTAADATSGLFWNPPALNGSADWAIEWTQQTIAGNADGPGAASVTTPGVYTNAVSGQMPWRVSADATSISLSLATTSLSTIVAASSGTLASRATTEITRYGISYNHATDTFHFYRSDNVTATRTRTAAGLPTTGQWSSATHRPIIFASVGSNYESRIQDVALFDVHRTQAQFNAGTLVAGLPIAPSFIWASASSGLTGTPVTTATVAVPTMLITGSNSRDISPPTAYAPGFSGTATLSGTTVVAAPAFYDTAGVSTGSSGIWSRTVTGAGTANINTGGGFWLDWALVTNIYDTIVQSARSTVASTGVISHSLSSAPASGNIVLAIIQYGQDGNTPSAAATPSGWTTIAHVGRNSNTYSEYVWVLMSTQQSIALDLSNGQGRDVVLLELST